MDPAHKGFQNPFGSFELSRYPTRKNEPLQAWCAADTLLLEEIHARSLPTQQILVVNDAHGALCVALQPAALWTDSALAEIALQRNEQTNDTAAVPIVWSTEAPPAAPVVALRIPKQRGYFEYQLSRLSNCLAEDAIVLAAGMDKHLSPHTAALLEHYIGPTQRHRGRSKARLFTSRSDGAYRALPSGQERYFCEQLNASLVSMANVFSGNSLDPGTRFLLSQLPSLTPVATLIDLACGNGILGLVAHKAGLAAQVTFIDESRMAIESARINSGSLFGPAEKDFCFHHGDGLDTYAGEPAELILCNPPFHLDHTVDAFAGTHLLAQCARHLRPGGLLCLVGNRHLNYAQLLQRSFARVEKLAGNNKFNIILARKRG